VKQSSISGAIEHLGITDSFIKKSQEEGVYDSLDSVIKSVDSSNGKIHIIQSPNLSKVVDSLGGVAGTLRWKQH
jgi:stalled ribosome rescue protein Dom34